MADQREIVLRQGASPGTDIVLRALAVADVSDTTIYLFAPASPSTDIILRNPATITAAFPAQFAGFRIYDSGVVKELCLVAVADAPAGMGGQLRLRKGVTTYAVYLVETGDANASPVRIRTTTGVKAVRLKT